MKAIDIKEKISLLWMVIMVNMIFADILSFMIELEKGSVVKVPHVNLIMFIAAIVTQIPILMIYFSRTLPYSLNRKLNMFASIFTIIYVVGGGSLLPHYIFIAGVEVICCILIFRKAMDWKEK